MTALSFTAHHIEQIMRGKKTQTRRLWKPGEHLGEYVHEINPQRGLREVVPAVFSPSGRVKWYVGARRAVKAGRTARGLFYVEIVDLWWEALDAISREDAIAEGCLETPGAPSPREQYRDLWNRLHPRAGARWEDNPEVWVLEFTGVF